MHIRQATPSDYDRIHAFVREAFRTARVSDGNEQDFVLRLRDGASVPELELIAEEEESLLGHIMLTDAVIRHADAEIPALLLAPLSVALERRGQGIGAALVREALNRAAGLGHAPRRARGRQRLLQQIRLPQGRSSILFRHSGRTCSCP